MNGLILLTLNGYNKCLSRGRLMNYPGNAGELKDYPKEIILKDGTGVTIRTVREGDKKGLLEMFKHFPESELWFLDHDLSDPGYIHDWVMNLELKREISIIALLEGRIIANTVLRMKNFGAESHIGRLKFSVVPSFRDKGLGTWMLLDIINLAISRGLQMLVIHLEQDREPSIINWIKKFNFHEEAVLENYLSDREGNFHNLVVMTKRLYLEWDDIY